MVGRGGIRVGVRCVFGMFMGIGLLLRFFYGGYFGVCGIKMSRGRVNVVSFVGNFSFFNFFLCFRFNLILWWKE